MTEHKRLIAVIKNKPKIVAVIRNKEPHLEEVSIVTTTKVTCKYCESKKIVKYGKKGEVQYYLCRDCGRTFAGSSTLQGMKYPPEQIAAGVSLFYSGLSIDAIRRELDAIYHVYPSDSTVYDWITRYTKVAINAKFSNLKVGSEWTGDETYLKLGQGKDIWFWDIIDNDTRFLLASHISTARHTKDAEALIQNAYIRAGKIPRVVYTDKLAAYLDGIEMTFGAETKYKQGSPFDIENSTNYIERFHETLKTRTKIMRGMHNKETATLIMDGWLVYYNFFRPHESLGNKTPAQEAKAHFPFKNWLEVVQAK